MCLDDKTERKVKSRIRKGMQEGGGEWEGEWEEERKCKGFYGEIINRKVTSILTS